MAGKNSVKANSRGLGRGLSALFSDSSNVQEAVKEAILENNEVSRETPIDLIYPNPNQPRRHFDDDELNALADTIKEHGIVQPIVIRPYEGKAGCFSIIAGERRWRAAQIVGLHKVPTVLKEFDDLETLKVSIVENLQRQNLNPIEEATSFSQLMDRFGYSQQNIADTIGKSRAYVANTTRLLNLPPEVKQMVIDGKLSAGHARAVLSAKDPVAVAKLIVENNLSVREAEKLASKGILEHNDDAKNAAPKFKKVENEDTKALVDDLELNLGLAVKLSHLENNAGSITISYKNIEELDSLCRILMKTSM